MSKRQIWLTDEERDLARRVCEYAKATIDDQLSRPTTATERFALSWSRASVARLAIKFSDSLRLEPSK